MQQCAQGIDSLVAFEVLEPVRNFFFTNHCEESSTVFASTGFRLAQLYALRLFQSKRKSLCVSFELAQDLILLFSIVDSSATRYWKGSVALVDSPCFYGNNTLKSIRAIRCKCLSEFLRFSVFGIVWKLLLSTIVFCSITPLSLNVRQIDILYAYDTFVVASARVGCLHRREKKHLFLSHVVLCVSRICLLKDDGVYFCCQKAIATRFTSFLL